jgi:hypothetical protein
VPPVPVADLRFGAAPLPEPFPGYDPAGDARALIVAGTPSPAEQPVPGREVRASTGPGQRYFVRVPDVWNGRLAVCGTPATRSEHANDAIFGDYLLARGYAYAASNKGIPFNARLVEGPASGALAYDVPFTMGNAPPGSASIRFGALEPVLVPVAAWRDDYANLVRNATATVRELTGRDPERVYAIGLSIGGGQVRWLLERHAELVDGGLEWAAVYWDVRHAFIRYLPHFLELMPAYAASGYRDRTVHDAIVAAGFPPDRLQAGGLASLWDAHYGKLPPFYADVTTFLFAGVLDAPAPPPATAAARAAYVPSSNAERAIAEVAHTGRLGKPLVGIAGDADVFITPQHNFDPYREAVVAAACGERYWQYEVAGGTHVDPYASLGWDLQPQLPFAWRAFEQLVGIVERGTRPPGAGTKRTVRKPNEIPLDV